jgi:hypothetical protein
MKGEFLNQLVYNRLSENQKRTIQMPHESNEAALTPRSTVTTYTTDNNEQYSMSLSAVSLLGSNPLPPPPPPQQLHTTIDTRGDLLNSMQRFSQQHTSHRSFSHADIDKLSLPSATTNKTAN